MFFCVTCFITSSITGYIYTTIFSIYYCRRSRLYFRRPSLFCAIRSKCCSNNAVFVGRYGCYTRQTFQKLGAKTVVPFKLPWFLPQDPLDQIHEPDASLPVEVGSTATGSDGSSHAWQGGEHRRDRLSGSGEKGSLQRPRSGFLYLEKGVPLRDSVMWKLQRFVSSQC